MFRRYLGQGSEKSKKHEDFLEELQAEHIKSPHPLLSLMEVPRGLMEAAALPVARPFMRNFPKGEPHPVLVLPGMAANDYSTIPLRSFISSLDYEAYPWELGFNRGAASVGEDGEHILERVKKIRDDWGVPVSLVGWSLGGLIAREVAKIMPENVGKVITLGSPLTGSPMASPVVRVYRYLSGHDTVQEDIETFGAELRRPPEDIPTTSILSFTDGIVPWENSAQRSTSLSESVVVAASHLGMGFNPMVYYVIADRLAQGHEDWEPFDFSGWRGLVYGPAD